MKYVLVGDGESPHLLKWARELNIRADLWVASSRRFHPDFDQFLPEFKRYSFNSGVSFYSWFTVYANIVKFGFWLKKIDPDILNPHYLTSHGLLAVIVKFLFKLRATIVGSAWGSDILLNSKRNLLIRFLLKYTLNNCAFVTSDSNHMAEIIKTLCSSEVIVFPFGINDLPASTDKDNKFFFANRALEPIYNPEQILLLFSAIIQIWPDAYLVVANCGSLESVLKQWVVNNGLSNSVKFVGLLEPEVQFEYYSFARWYLSLPRSDSISVSVIEAMSNGCIPILSNLPANRELVTNNINGFIIDDIHNTVQKLTCLDDNELDHMSNFNRHWVKKNAIFSKSMNIFMKKLNSLNPDRF